VSNNEEHLVISNSAMLMNRCIEIYQIVVPFLIYRHLLWLVVITIVRRHLNFT